MTWQGGHLERLVTEVGARPDLHGRRIDPDDIAAERPSDRAERLIGVEREIADEMHRSAGRVLQPDTRQDGWTRSHANVGYSAQR